MDAHLDDNESIRVVTVGHVDHGKSTLIGRLIYDLGQVQDGKYEELKKVTKKRGMGFEWAFLLDALQTERNQGITIDTTQIFFKTKKRNYIFIDAPGHKEFLRNMITGASSADLAILIVDVEEGIQEQTKKHGYLLKLLGITDVVVVFNKMDKIKFDEQKFLEVKVKLDNFLNKIGVVVNNIIPVSATSGENINNKSTKMNWYKGLNLVQAIDDYEVKKELSSLPFRMPIQDIYKFDDKRIIVGKIESGTLSNKDKLLFSPSNSVATIKTIETWPKNKRDVFQAGECIGIVLNEKNFLEKGDVISHNANPPNLVNTFEANIFWLSEQKINLSKKYILKLATSEHKITFKKILKVIDTESLDKKEKNIVKKNDVAEVVINSLSLVTADNFALNPKLGRFSIVDNYSVVGGGIINLKDYPNQRNFINKPNKNIIPFDFSITETDRTSRLEHRPGIIWFTGLSGSGKSTIAREIEKRLFFKGYNVFVLDGDNLRQGLNKDLSFSPEDRTENIRRTAEVASLFSYAGFLVIISLISPYRSERKKARSIRPEIFREIYIKSSLEKCIERDTKGLYAKAKKGMIENFTGISAPYEKPESPDLVLDTQKNNIKDTVGLLENYIVSEFGISKN